MQPLNNLLLDSNFYMPDIRRASTKHSWSVNKHRSPNSWNLLVTRRCSTFDCSLRLFHQEVGPADKLSRKCRAALAASQRRILLRGQRSFCGSQRWLGQQGQVLDVGYSCLTELNRRSISGKASSLHGWKLSNAGDSSL